MTNTVSNNTLPPVLSAIWARTDLIMEDKMEGAKALVFNSEPKYQN